MSLYKSLSVAERAKIHKLYKKVNPNMSYRDIISDFDKEESLPQYGGGGETNPPDTDTPVKYGTPEYKKAYEEDKIVRVNSDGSYTAQMMKPFEVVDFKDKDTSEFFNNIKKTDLILSGKTDTYKDLLKIQEEIGNPTVSRKRTKWPIFNMGKGAYNPFTHHISLDDTNSAGIETYLHEAAHAKQFKDRGKLNVMSQWLANDLPSYIKEKYMEDISPYHKEGTVEHEAHEIIQPELKKKVRGLKLSEDIHNHAYGGYIDWTKRY
jgi:hypothetical protein